MKDKKEDEVGELNAMLLKFAKLQLSSKCALLTRMLSNLEDHVKRVGGSYDKLIEEIIKSSKGGNKK